jgi:hypothetical protein
MPADKKWDAATRKQVVALYTKGTKLRDISVDTGVPVSTIFHILREEEVAPARMTRRKLEPHGPSDQVTTLEWFVAKLYEQEREVERLRALLLEWNIDPETGEALPQ